MGYSEFKAKYTELFNTMMTYSPDQVGAGHYAEKMADMEEEHPEWADKAEQEAAA